MFASCLLHRVKHPFS